jgi:hypothetical protein
MHFDLLVFALTFVVFLLLQMFEFNFFVIWSQICCFLFLIRVQTNFGPLHFQVEPSFLLINLKLKV